LLIALQAALRKGRDRSDGKADGSEQEGQTHERKLG
jgi:hypothetical protein